MCGSGSCYVVVFEKLPIRFHDMNRESPYLSKQAGKKFFEQADRVTS